MMTQHKFLGITTLGEKGQIVIPAEARRQMKLKPGERIMVMMPHNGAIILLKASQLESFAKSITKRIASVKKLIKNAKI